MTLNFGKSLFVITDMVPSYYVPSPVVLSTEHHKEFKQMPGTDRNGQFSLWPSAVPTLILTTPSKPCPTLHMEERGQDTPGSHRVPPSGGSWPLGPSPAWPLLPSQCLGDPCCQALPVAHGPCQAHLSRAISSNGQLHKAHPRSSLETAACSWGRPPSLSRSQSRVAQPCS